MLFSDAWEKVIHEKTWSKKSRDTVSLITIFAPVSLSVFLPIYFLFVGATEGRRTCGPIQENPRQ